MLYAVIIYLSTLLIFFFFQAEDGIRDYKVTGVQTCALPISRDAYSFLEKVPLDILAYILAEVSNAKAVGKVRNYLYKWRPLRQALPSAETELEALGLPRGPKFDKVIADLFQQQLLGKGRNPEERSRLLRKLAGIKEPPKKKVKEEKKKPDVKPGKKRVGPAESAAHEAKIGPAKASTPSTVTAAHTTAKAAAAAKGASAAAAHQPPKGHSKAHSNRR